MPAWLGLTMLCRLMMLVLLFHQHSIQPSNWGCLRTFKDALAHNMHNLQLYWYPTIYILYRVSWARPGPTCPLSWWRSWYIFPAGLNGGLPWKWTQEGFQQALLEDLQIFRYSFKNLYTIYNIIHIYIYNICIYTYGKSRVWYKPWGPQYVQLTQQSG